MPGIKKKIIWIVGIVVALAILAFAYWKIYLTVKPSPVSNEIPPEVLKSLTAPGTTSAPVSRKTLKRLTATSTAHFSPEDLKNLTAPK